MRKATKKDLPKIMVLIKKTFAPIWQETNRTIDEKFVKKRIQGALKKDLLLVEENNKTIIGFGWAKHSKDFFGNKFGEIKILSIKPSFQAKGLGTKILKQLENQLNEKDTRLECLTTNQAKKLYKKQGYKKFLETLRKTKEGV